MTEEDQIRLLESRHDIQAVTDPASLTPVPAYQAAVATSRDNLQAARDALVLQVAHNTTEQSETDTERANVQKQLGNAREHYRFYRSRTRDALLNPAPGVKLSPEESARRQRLYDRYYKLNNTALSFLALDKQVEILDALLTAYQTEEELKDLGHGPILEAAIRPAIAAIQEFHREVREDLLATRTLVEARTTFDRAHRFHIQLVDSLLQLHERAHDAGHFLKRRDPAYAARRKSRKPIAEEPESHTIETEILAPQPTPA